MPQLPNRRPSLSKEASTIERNQKAVGSLRRKHSRASVNCDIQMTTSSELPGAIIIHRTDQARQANPERLNLDKRNLECCPLVEGEGRLRLLNLQNNRIRKMGHFYGLPNLIFLDLYNNRIEVSR